MDHVSWTRGPNSAIDDLKDLPSEVRLELMVVAEVELKAPPDLDPNDLDEGVDSRAESPVLFRRGITRERRRELADAESRRKASDDDDDGSNAWDYVLLYRERSFKEVLSAHKKGFVVLRVVHNRYPAPTLLRKQGDLESSGEGGVFVPQARRGASRATRGQGAALAAGAGAAVAAVVTQALAAWRARRRRGWFRR